MKADEGPPQLQIGGGEVPTEQARRTASTGHRPELTGAQRAILAVVERQGYIRPVEAGEIIHSHRGSCGRAGAGEHKGAGTKARLGCCGYAATDGSSALKRLEERGLLRRQADARRVRA